MRQRTENPGPSLVTHGAVDDRTRLWLQRVRSALRVRCRGVAYITAATGMLAGQTRTIVATRRAGCHVEAFDNALAAQAWAHGGIAGASLALVTDPADSRPTQQ